MKRKEISWETFFSVLEKGSENGGNRQEAGPLDFQARRGMNSNAHYSLYPTLAKMQQNP